MLDSVQLPASLDGASISRGQSSEIGGLMLEQAPSICSELDKMIQDMRKKGLDRVRIYMSQITRKQLREEIVARTLVIPYGGNHVGAQLEEYMGCPIVLLPDDADPSIYVAAF